MEIAILICCIIIIILLFVLLIKISAGGDDTEGLEKEIALLRESGISQTRHIEASVREQGESLRSAQERQTSRMDGVFEKFRTEIDDFKDDTNASLDRINRIVTEKLRDILDKHCY